MALEDIVNEMTIGHRLKKNNFSQGFFYFFGLADNPYDKVVKSIYLSDVEEGLRRDWKNLSKDFSKTFATELQNLEPK